MLSACGDLTRIAVTCACILTSLRSTMAHAFGFIAKGTLSYRLKFPKEFTSPQFRYNVLAPIIFGAESLDE